MYWAKGADIASAATLVVGADGNYFDVTGSTGPVTAMTVPVGMLFMLHFISTPTLTHHATNLNLPSAADIVVASDDTAICFSPAANQVYVLDYRRADGTSVKNSVSVQAPVAKSDNTVYQAATDGILQGYYTLNVSTGVVNVYTDSANPPTTVVQLAGPPSTGACAFPIFVLIKKNNYYKAVGTNFAAAVLEFVPLTS
jgi:hypothetical protein